MCMLCAAMNPRNLAAYGATHLPNSASIGAISPVSSGTSALAIATTLDALAVQLTTGYWAYYGQGARSFLLGADRQISVNLTALDAQTQNLARIALAAWSDITGINFVDRVSAQITFDDSGFGKAYSNSYYSGTTLTTSTINISQDWDGDEKSVNSYWFQTYLHEIGHALGLGHGGNYNGSATWGVDNTLTNDSWQATVMSYFAQSVNTNTGGASYAFTATLMAADIVAIQSLYGTNVQARADDTVYGNHSNVAGYLGDLFDQWLGGALAQTAVYIGNPVTMTLFDTGGIDTLDVSGTQISQRVDLFAEATSDVAGLIGNIIIARGTVIENATGGDGNDTLSGNAAANVLTGGNGADRLDGRSGADTLLGGGGNDTMIGGSGEDLLFGGAGSDRFDGGTERDTVSYATSTAAILVDMVSVSLNTGDAAGDTFVGIEGVTGGFGADTLRGSAGADVLQGMANADRLFGRGGKDTLDGGAGDDLLVGGVGADALIGGEGRDLADYSAAARGVSANLSITTFSGTLPSKYVTEASGDTFVSVEDLVGSQWNDRLTGNASDNALFGKAGNDTLYGSLGDDTLTGGTGADTFVFKSGTDLVMDFVDNIDTISIARSLFGTATASVAQALAFAVVEGSNIVFHFNQMDTFILNGVVNISALQDDLIFG